jgi:hypothetical protein
LEGGTFPKIRKLGIGCGSNFLSEKSKRRAMAHLVGGLIFLSGVIQMDSV